MGLTQEFQDKVKSITSELKSASDLNHIFGEGIARIIDKNLTNEQKEIIKQNASQTVFADPIGIESTDGEKIAHAFNDPVSKSSFALKLSSDDNSLLAALVTTEESLKSVINNMPKIMGSNMPPQINIVIDSYKGTLDNVSEMKEMLSKQVDNAEDIINTAKAGMMNGNEYIAPLPDDFPEI